MNIGLHCRLAGRPGRLQAVKSFLDYAIQQTGVWFATRLSIAECWQAAYPFKPRYRPSQMTKKDFISTFGSVFEHSAWVAEQAYDTEISPAIDTATGLHSALCRQFRLASPKQRLEVLSAHPDLAGKLAKAKKLTDASTIEQSSAGLDVLTEAQQLAFTDLNEAYREKFDFPFILAVKGLSAIEIKSIFEQRLSNPKEQEFEEACGQVEKIARLRIEDIFSNMEAKATNQR